MKDNGKQLMNDTRKITRGMVFRVIGGLCLAIFLLSFPHIFTSNYLRNLAILTCMWAIGGQAWNVLSGYGSRYSMGHAIFFGLGAYSSAVLFSKYGISPWIGMIIGMLVSSSISVIVGFPTFKLTPAYYGMATLGFTFTLQAVFLNWRWVGDSRGVFMPLLRKSSILDFQFANNKTQYYYIVLFLLVLSYLLVYKVSKSKLGFYIRAMKEDELAAQSLGVDVMKNLQIVGIISASLASVAGTFYAQYMLYVDPMSVYNSITSNNFILSATLGGIATIAGPLIGAIIFIPTGELIRGWIGGSGKAFDQMLWGFVIILIAIYRPSGILGWFKEHAKFFSGISKWMKEPIVRSNHDNSRM
jgi:branched-chain amino acid transport system permease protein